MLHPNVAEAAVVGYPHPVKGEGIYIYVTVNDGVDETDELRNALRMQCRAEIGAFAAPDAVHWAPALPKTRSGKIMRRYCRRIATHQRGPAATMPLPPARRCCQHACWPRPPRALPLPCPRRARL